MLAFPSTRPVTRGSCSYNARLFTHDLTAIRISYRWRREFPNYARLHRGRAPRNDGNCRRTIPVVTGHCTFYHNKTTNLRFLFDSCHYMCRDWNGTYTHLTMECCLFREIDVTTVARNGVVNLSNNFPDSKAHGTNLGPTWVLSASDGPHVGPMNFPMLGPMLSGFCKHMHIWPWNAVSSVKYTCQQLPWMALSIPLSISVI